MPRPSFAAAILRNSVACALSLLLLTAPRPGGAQTPQDQVLAFGESTSGLTLVGEVLTGGLPGGQERVVPLELAGGEPYMVVAFCDDQCGDMDLLLRDPSGNQVDSNFLGDAQPVLTFTTGAQGTFQLNVIMVRCSAGTCAYSVGIFQGGQGGAAQPEAEEDAGGSVEAIRSRLEGEGFIEMGEIDSGELQSGQDVQFSVLLRGGMEYRLVGVCDENCTDLDLRFFDPSGAEVASDIRVGATPVVGALTTSDGEHGLNVAMVSCRADTCRFRVIGFTREPRQDPEGGEPTVALVPDNDSGGGSPR